MQTHYSSHHIAPPAVDRPGASIPSDLDEYLFDLQGFVIVRGALDKTEIDAANAAVDQIPRSVARNAWHGRVHREDHPEHRGISYQQIYELGEPFEKLIDHPNYINYVMRFVGGHETYDRSQGPVFIDENFYNLRGPGDAIPIHAGGHDHCRRGGFDYHDGRFNCGQINVLFAFNDIGPGDGATMVIPGSHKSNIIHPALLQDGAQMRWTETGGGSLDGIPGAVEVHLKAGDAIVFVDALCHGSAKRVNPGVRRIAVYRYGSAWNRTRFGYEPSPELLARLNPFARSIVSTGRKFVPEG
jgi:ectoine hydroxylase-related dioxygenase (phytanoyl-CoA dioxygenase family)